MKILHVLHSIDPRSGGPSNVIRNLVQQQAADGHQVALLTTDAQSAEPWAPRQEFVQRMSQDPAFAKIELFQGTAYGRRPPWGRYSFTPACRRWLRRRLADADLIPDVIHIHGVFSHLTTLAARLARSYSVPYIIRPAGSLNDACFRLKSHSLKKVFSGLSLRRNVSQAALVQATAETEREHIKSWSPSTKVRVIPNGAELPIFDRKEVIHQFHERFPDLRGRRIILYMSRVAPKKRLDLLVEAVARLKKEYPEIILLVAGHDSGYMEVVRQAVETHGVQDNVRFAGFLENTLRHGAFAVSDLFALPSLDENFGVAVVDAMAHSLPSLVTPGVASHIYVDAARAGLTVDGEVEAIAAGIKELLAADRAAMGARGRRFVKENLTWPSIAEKLEALYRESIEG